MAAVFDIESGSRSPWCTAVAMNTSPQIKKPSMPRIINPPRLPTSLSSIASSPTETRLDLHRNSTQLPIDKLVNHITNLITSRPKQRIIKIPNVPPQLFEDCTTTLLAKPTTSIGRYFDTKLFYEYDKKLEQIIVTFESAEHEAISRILSLVVEAVRSSDFVPSSWSKMVTERGSPTIELSHNGYSGKFKPDGSLSFTERDPSLPVLVVEVAHSQSEKYLLRAGCRWLLGSDFLIRTAILLKINYPGPVTKVKLWVFRVGVTGNERFINCWGPKIIWTDPPEPLPEPEPALELRVEDIFGELTPNLPADYLNRSSMLSIPFTELRKWCTTALMPKKNSLLPSSVKNNMKNELKSLLGKRLRTDNLKGLQETTEDDSDVPSDKSEPEARDECYRDDPGREMSGERTVRSLRVMKKLKMGQSGL